MSRRVGRTPNLTLAGRSYLGNRTRVVVVVVMLIVHNMNVGIKAAAAARGA